MPQVGTRTPAGGSTGTAAAGARAAVDPMLDARLRPVPDKVAVREPALQLAPRGHRKWHDERSCRDCDGKPFIPGTGNGVRFAARTMMTAKDAPTAIRPFERAWPSGRDRLNAAEDLDTDPNCPQDLKGCRSPQSKETT